MAGPRAWNKLPPLLCHVHSAVTFKHQLEAFLYNNAFNLHCYAPLLCFAIYVSLMSTFYIDRQIDKNFLSGLAGGYHHLSGLLQQVSIGKDAIPLT